MSDWEVALDKQLAYVKGPDDKPLVVRGARVFRWAR